MIGRWQWVALLGALAGCAEGQPPVTFVSNEQPTSQSGRASDLGVAAVHTHANGGHGELPQDDEIVEPDHPAVDGKSERALVHIHTPEKTTCSGVVLGPKLVATAANCLKEPKGANAIAAGREYRIEVASTTLTWTVRSAKFAVVPDCDQDQLDAAILVLNEAVAWIDPPKVVSAPSSGSKIKALGFGRCGDQPKGTVPKVTRTGSVTNRDDAAVVIDIPLCHGDVGGPVVDNSNGDVIGLISHREDPEGSPLRTTTITRLDTHYALRLVERSKQIADTGETGAFKEIRCRAR